MKQETAKVKIKGNEYVIVDIRYNLGGYNYGTMEEQPRGYSVHVTPETHNGDMRTVRAFSGFKHFLHGVNRKSDKAYVSAVRKAVENEKDLIERMITVVCMQEKVHATEIKRVVKEAMTKLEEHYEEVK